jgi:hypothetical protein
MSGDIYPGPEPLSGTVALAAEYLVYSVDKYHGTKNGQTALYWHLVSVITQHRLERKRTMAKKRIENPCGCHVDGDRIIYCDGHGKAQAIATVLDQCRRYFLAGDAGEESPLVKRIDSIIPRIEG